MKFFKRFFYICILVTTILAAGNSVFSAVYDSVSPTQPPRVPVTDYGDGSHGIIDFLFLRYTFDIGDLNGIGFGYNYVNNFDNTNTAYNLGAGFIYLNGTGSIGSTDIDIYNWNLPLNANLGIRVFGTKDSNNLMIFGGIHWTYTWLVVTAGDDDVYLYGPAFGPLLGVKAQFKINNDVSLIPFYIFHRAMFDYSLEINGQPYDVSIDPVTSQFIGFDIKFGSMSIGALFDMLNNTDNDKITIMFTYDLDYSSSGSSGNENIQGEKNNNRKPKRN